MGVGRYVLPGLAAGLDDLAQRFAGKRIIAVTSHRRENFGGGMEAIARSIADIAARPDVAVIFPVHPNPNVRPVMEAVLGELPELQPVLAWRARAQVVKWLPVGSFVGYGCNLYWIAVALSLWTNLAFAGYIGLQLVRFTQVPAVTLDGVPENNALGVSLSEGGLVLAHVDVRDRNIKLLNSSHEVAGRRAGACQFEDTATGKRRRPQAPNR